MANQLNISGERYNYLIAVERIGTSKSGCSVWKFRCDCGKEKIALLNNVRRGRTKSCGCRWILHGDTHSPEHRSWLAMINRCKSPSYEHFHRYGGRGIKICERWETFTNFLIDMGRKPSSEYSLDRIDNDGNYEPGNCRWATAKDQGRNRSTNHHLFHDGKLRTMAEIVEAAGEENCRAVRERLRKGWGIKRAINEPIRERA